MKKVKTLLFFLLFTFTFTLGFAQGWVWGEKGYGAIKTDMISSAVATDRYGNAYLGGSFENLLILGGDTLYGNVNETAFLAKYSPAGAIAWGKVITGNYWSYTNGIATDPSGNIYATGYFDGNAQADTFNLYGGSIYNSNVFLIKYYTNGKIAWVRQSTLPTHYLNSGGIGCSVTTDNTGNILVSGLFTDTLTFGHITLNTVYNDTDAFLVKYDSNGNVLWAEQSSSLANHNSTYTYYSQLCAVATDKQSNAYITGSFHGTLSFGSYTLHCSNSYEGFIVKYSPSGNVLWAKQTTGPANSQCVPYSATTDRSGNSYITGFFQDSLSIGSHTLYAKETTIFFAKYDTTGNVLWAEQSSPQWIGSGLTSDGFNGHIYMTGSCLAQADSVKFKNYTLYTNKNNASFVMEFDTAGNPICGSLVNNLGCQPLSANGIASYYIGITGAYLYVGNTYQSDTVFCGPDTLLPYGGTANTFIGKWESCDGQLGTPKITAQNGRITLYPNPSSGMFTFQAKSDELGAKSIVEVYNMIGQQVYSNSFSINNSQFTINLANQPNGVYLYRVISDNGSLIGDGKLIIQK